MRLLNIIDTIYESKYFPTILLVSILILVVLFTAVVILGLRDSKKSKEPKEKKLEDLKDITFESPKEIEKVKEDVTFEIPVLTENLENFKKSLEEEMLKEDEIRVQRRIAANQKELKPKKILDKKTIDDTAVLPILTDEVIEKVEAEEPKKIEEKKIVKEEIKEEEKTRKRDIIKELFKDRKEKNVEPPKVQIDERESKAILVDEKKEQSKTIPAKKENNSNQVTEVKKEEKKLEHKRIDYQPEILDETPLPKKEEKEKKESRYSDDDDF